MEPRDLEVFVACVELGSMTRAAERVHVVQSAVSQAVARLERAYGISLLERRRGGVRPTEAGAALAVHARGILTALERAREDLQAYAGLEKGTIRLGMLHTATALVLVPILRALRSTHPGLRLHAEEGTAAQLAEGLTTGTLDLVVVFLPADLGSVEVVPLAPVELVVIEAAGGADGSPRSSGPHRLAALAAEPWVAFPSDNPGRRWLDESCARAGFTPRISAEVGTFAQLKDFVAAGVGLGMVPAQAVRAELGAHVLTARPFFPVTDVRLGYAYRSPQQGRAPSALRVLLEQTLGP